MADTVDLTGRRFGEFVLREPLGEGSFGVVYCCDQPLLGREAVVKVLRPKLHKDDVAVMRFLREAQLAAALDHPYAAHVYAFGVEEHDGLLWIAMERVHGITLKSWLTTRGPMSLEQFVPFFEGVAEVVQTAHERGIVHRDLKPANMMVLERAGRLLPKLLDFGVAKLLDGVVLPETTPELIKRVPLSEALPGNAPEAAKSPIGTATRTGAWSPPKQEDRGRLSTTVSSDASASQREARSRLTSDNATIGSPPYISPEQWTNAVTVGPASDLYALGVTAFEALAGYRPFDGFTLAEYAELHCQGEIPMLDARFPPALNQVFQRALAKRPEDRWKTALELARALRTASGIGAVSADLPRLDNKVRDTWLATAPQPLAESLAALDGAQNAHEARERVQELVRTLLRYLLTVAIATRTHVDDDLVAPELLELVRALGRRELSAEERLQLLRLLVRKDRAHPLPELAELVAPDEDGNDALDSILAMYSIAEHSGTDSAVRLRLRELFPRLNQLLHRTSVLFRYVLVVRRDGKIERWTGPRKLERAAVTVMGGDLTEYHPMLLDQHGRVCVNLWPLVQAATPSNGADAELFMFEARGRHGAQLIAAPRGITRDDSAAWDWIESRLVADVEIKSRMREQLRMAARQWEDRGRSEDLLWRGDALADIDRWSRHTAAADPFPDPEASFLAASRRMARRGRRIRRLLVATAVAGVVGGVEYRSVLHDRMAEHELVQAEVEQGRQALLHDGLAEAQQHLSEAYRRGDHSPAVAFMLARALQPRLAVQARFSAVAGRTWSATFSPDGQQILTTDDHAAQVWNAQTHQRLHVLRHGDTVYEARYTVDGTRILTASGVGAVRVWNAASGDLVRELRHDGALRYFTVAASPDGKLVAAMDTAGAVAHVWDIATGDVVADLPNDGSKYPALAFSADGRWLATTGGDKAYVFDASTWKPVLTLAGPHVRTLSWDPTGPRLATGGARGDLSIWEVPRGARAQHLRDVGSTIRALAFSPDGRFVAAGGADGIEQIWEAGSGALQSQLGLPQVAIQALAWDPTSRLTAAALANGAVLVGDPVLKMPVAMLDGPQSGVRSVRFDPTSRHVVGASVDGTAWLWDATSPYRRWSSPPIADECSLSTSLEPDRQFIAIGCGDHATRIVDTAHGELLAELPSVTPVEGDFASAFPAVSADGARAAIARGNAVEVFALPGGHPMYAVEQGAPVTAVAFAPAGHDLITGGSDGSLVVTPDGREPIRLALSGPAIDTVMILPDGRAVATDARKRLRIYDTVHRAVLVDLEVNGRIGLLRASPDGRRLLSIPSSTIPSVAGTAGPPALWDLERHRLIGLLTEHTGRVFAARWITDEILTAGSDSTVRRWDPETGRLLQTYRGASSPFSDATISPDGSTVIAGAGDGSVWFWEATGRSLWKLPAHASRVIGIHFEGDDLVTRGFAGDVSRWTFPSADRVLSLAGAN